VLAGSASRELIADDPDPKMTCARRVVWARAGQGAGRSPARDVVAMFCSGGGGEGDVVSEGLELSDEVAGFAVLVEMMVVEV
jgi:hypothetical protein